ncbi:Hypothetical protein D9617_13g100470 [Elsinoe fawcettii]|nr:Hypothetical protein D9617_13g100470 [Elsinoe fawcettii]
MSPFLTPPPSPRHDNPDPQPTIHTEASTIRMIRSLIASPDTPPSNRPTSFGCCDTQPWTATIHVRCTLTRKWVHLKTNKSVLVSQSPRFRLLFADLPGPQRHVALLRLRKAENIEAFNAFLRLLHGLRDPLCNAFALARIAVRYGAEELVVPIIRWRLGTLPVFGEHMTLLATLRLEMDEVGGGKWRREFGGMPELRSLGRREAKGEGREEDGEGGEVREQGQGNKVEEEEDESAEFVEDLKANAIKKLEREGMMEEESEMTDVEIRWAFGELIKPLFLEKVLRIVGLVGQHRRES